MPKPTRHPSPTHAPSSPSKPQIMDLLYHRSRHILNVITSSVDGWVQVCGGVGRHGQEPGHSPRAAAALALGAAPVSHADGRGQQSVAGPRQDH